MSEQYASGAMDPYIRQALDQADMILDIYRTVSTVNHPPGWLPVSVICENCGKIGTTRSARLGRLEVSYQCLPDLVEWASGCGFARSCLTASVAAPSWSGTWTGPRAGA